MDMNHSEQSWSNLNAQITFYPKYDIQSKGLSLVIDHDVYTHNISITQPMCKNMKNQYQLCLIYAEMRYQDEFSETSLNHLYECQHPDDTECKYGDECHSYKRLEAGGNDLNEP